MGFGEAIRTCFSKYATFSGRARRSEYWFFWLFTTIALLVAELIDAAATGSRIVETIIGLVLAVPSLAVLVRRLHDVDRTGWWVLLTFVPMIAFIMVAMPVARSMLAVYFILLVVLVVWIVLLVWCCKRGTPGPNRYGSDPFAGAIGAASA